MNENELRQIYEHIVLVHFFPEQNFYSLFGEWEREYMYTKEIWIDFFCSCFRCRFLFQSVFLLSLTESIWIITDYHVCWKNFSQRGRQKEEKKNVNPFSIRISLALSFCLSHSLNLYGSILNYLTVRSEKQVQLIRSTHKRDKRVSWLLSICCCYLRWESYASFFIRWCWSIIRGKFSLEQCSRILLILQAYMNDVCGILSRRAVA